MSFWGTVSHKTINMLFQKEIVMSIQEKHFITAMGGELRLTNLETTWSHRINLENGFQVLIVSVPTWEMLASSVGTSILPNVKWDDKDNFSLYFKTRL